MNHLNPPPVILDTIRAARQRIASAIYRSPCPYSLSLSRLCDAQIYCKLDHLQLTGSFKERGARNKLLLLSDEAKRAGVIAASAGNHALGLAYHGQLLKIPVTVVMPKWAPLVKLSNCRSLGANVILHGESYDEAKKHATDLSQQKNLTYIPGFDDPDIIAGQGTMGLEILEDVPDVDAVIVPIGGGGLIAGIATAIKSSKPNVRVIGVEPRNAPTMHESLRVGHVVHIDTQPTLADGLAVAEAGKLCFEIVRDRVDNVILVDEAQIALSVLRLLELEKTVVEGAGGVPLAAAMDKSLGLSGKKIVLCLSGGNIDLTLISRVIERGLATDGRLCRIVVRMSDRPGSLAKLAKIIAATGASVKDIRHERNFAPADVGSVQVICILETRDKAHIDEVGIALQKEGIEFRDASSLA
ncbi:MAG TPA: threonine ammonia-lyase [Tepidisphaeraceae bacterium]|nr:threonine ammonia-lyase [Tepidisphaeraceae bacterium]